jgi:hypothetical protein
LRADMRIVAASLALCLGLTGAAQAQTILETGLTYPPKITTPAWFHENGIPTMQRPQFKIEKENLRPIPQDLENNNHLISRGSGRPLKSTIPTQW